MRIITLDTNKKIVSTKNVLDDYIDDPGLQTGEIESNIGEIGQVQQTDGSFKVPEITLSLDGTKNSKIQQLEDKCNDVLNSGFTSNCLGTTRKFSSTDLNRSLIMGLVSKAQLLLNNVDLPDKNLDWKAEDDPVCYTWTPQQILVLGSDMSTFMTNTIKHKELLQAYVKTLTTVEEVQKVTWDTVIPTTTT